MQAIEQVTANCDKEDQKSTTKQAQGRNDTIT
jgi:hypothetical protein